jgi:hypothetical protein
MGVDHYSLCVLEACVVLEGSSIEACLLAEFGNSLLVVVGESVELEDTFSHIWSTHQVDLEKFGLEMTLIWSVRNQSFEQESSCLLDSSIFKEDLDH